MNKLTYRLMSAIVLLALTFGSYTNSGASSPTATAKVLEERAKSDILPITNTALFSASLPYGQTGSWNMVFEDNFDGTTLDLTKWAANWFNEGGNMNQVGTYAKNVSVSNGVLTLTLESSSRGALINTQSNNGFKVMPGMYAESRIMFPGNGSKLYNWPAWWLSGASWPSTGEHDIAEVLGGSLTVNYHSPSGSHNQGSVPGYWGDQYHVYAIYRKANTAEVYWDGKLVKSYSTDDNGKGEDLILNVGAGSPNMYGAAGAIQVDYVRVWKPGTGAIPTVTATTVTAVNTPTKSPTSTPTKAPTSTPTKIPTNIPTNIPTKVPTSVPTNLPTNVPTNIPTKVPTSVPTNIPTNIPTNVPTNIPTNVPTSVPTKPIPLTPVPAPSTSNMFPFGQTGSWNIAFEDNFDGSVLDLAKWRPNWLAGSDTATTPPINSSELSCYNPANVTVGGGSMTLNVTANTSQSCKTRSGAKAAYASGMVQSNSHFNTAYGYFEAKIWNPAGVPSKSVWPSFWTNGQSWPKDGAINIMDCRGADASCSYRYNYSGGAPGGSTTVTGSTTGWHVYAANWEPGKITWYYDGVQVWEYTTGIVSAPHYIILNLGVTGNQVTLPSQMSVDYVRVWKRGTATAAQSAMAAGVSRQIQPTALPTLAATIQSPTTVPTSVVPVLPSLTPTAESLNIMGATITNVSSPVIISNGNLSIAENTSAVVAVTATDADLPAQTLTYSIAGGADSTLFSINSSTGELAFITAPDYEAPVDAGLDNTYNITVQASDGTFVATQDVAIGVSAVNENAPVFTSNSNLSIGENTTTVATVKAADADLSAQILTYSIVGGADSALFSLNSSTGDLTFISAPDYEVPLDAGLDNVYNLTVQASDGTLVTAQDIAIGVSAVNDNTPAFTSNGNLSITENTMAVDTAKAADADLPAEAMTYSIVGGADSTLFSINPSTGELTFVTTSDYDVPVDAGLDNIYNVTIQAFDGTLSTTQDVTVSVTAVDDNTPVITSNGNLSIAENTMAVSIITATDVDLPAEALTYSIVGGADSALFSINASTGELTFITAPDYEAPVDAGLDNIYNITVQASDGILAVTQDVAIGVSAVNDNTPAITSSDNSLISENTMAVANITATDADLPAETLTYSIVGGADSALFSINASTGELTFITAPDFETPVDAGLDNIYNLSIQVSDGTVAATQDIAVRVDAVNDNTPAITSNGNLSIAENTMAVAIVAAADADLPTQTLTYSIVGGADTALFSINSSTGDLTFITAPDFEAPVDAGRDNNYNLTVQVSDGTLSVTQDITVTVSAVNDNTPAITSNGNLSIAENTTIVATVTAADADLPTQTLTYSIAGGADSALFSINSSTGELTFITAPDFEAPLDAGLDNIYNLTVQASDGTLSVIQDSVITVKSVVQSQ